MVTLEKIYQELKLLRREVLTLKKDSLERDLAISLADAKHGRKKGPFHSGEDLIKALQF